MTWWAWREEALGSWSRGAGGDGSLVRPTEFARRGSEGAEGREEQRRSCWWVPERLAETKEGRTAASQIFTTWDLAPRLGEAASQGS